MITGLFDGGNISALEAYPNPTSSLVQVELASPTSMNAIKIVVVNTSGTGIEVPYKIVNGTGRQGIELDLSDLSAGLYYVLVQDGKSLSKAKIVKE